MTDNTNLSGDDGFDEIVSGEDVDEGPEFLTPWQAVEEIWPDVVPNSVVTKGIIIVEHIDEDGRKLRWVTSPNMAEWDLLGLLHSTLADLQSQNFAMTLMPHDEYVGDLEDDEDE